MATHYGHAHLLLLTDRTLTHVLNPRLNAVTDPMLRHTPARTTPLCARPLYGARPAPFDAAAVTCRSCAERYCAERAMLDDPQQFAAVPTDLAAAAAGFLPRKAVA